MTVLIKGMPMPKNCTNCPLNIHEMSFGCAVTGRRYNWGNPERLSDCPLVEILTPHGRLIDENELAYLIGIETARWDAVSAKVDECSTVIEAE